MHVCMFSCCISCFVLEVPSCSMDMYSVMNTKFVLVMLYTVDRTASHCTSHCTPLCTSHCTPLYTSHCMSHCIFVILCIISTLHPSGVTLNIIITDSSSTHHPPQSNGDHSTWSEPKRRRLEEGVYWTVYICVVCVPHVLCYYIRCAVNTLYPN